MNPCPLCGQQLTKTATGYECRNLDCPNPDRYNPDMTKELPMTPEPDTITLPQLRKLLTELHNRMDSQVSITDAIRHDLETLITAVATITAGIQHAATAPDIRPLSGQTKSFLAVAIVHGIDDNGKEFYKMRGGPYSQKGVRVWPEVLPVLGLDAATLAHGVTQLEKPINVLVEMHDYYDKDTKETRVTPYKIIGLA